MPAVFSWLQKLGNVSTPEMDRVFNCGIGVVMISLPYYADSIREDLPKKAFRPSQLAKSATVSRELSGSIKLRLTAQANRPSRIGQVPYATDEQYGASRM